jgi:hypothetical protein
MMKRLTGTIFAAILLGMSVGAGSARADLLSQLGILDMNANGGINPATGVAWAGGDTYRFAFITLATSQGTSSDINTYNTFIQNQANGSTAFPNLGDVTWKCIGSTATVDARDNTSSNPGVDGTGEAVFLLNGSTTIADNYAALWDGSLDAVLRTTEENTTRATHGDAWGAWVGTWTGTASAGTATSPLGGGSDPRIGLAVEVNANWDSAWDRWQHCKPAHVRHVRAADDPRTDHALRSRRIGRQHDDSDFECNAEDPRHQC